MSPAEAPRASPGGEEASDGVGEAGAGAVNADREWAAFAEKRGAELLSLRGELDTDLVDGRRFDKGYREGLRQGDVQRALDIAARAADGDPGAAGQPSSMRSGKSVYAMANLHFVLILLRCSS